MTSIDSTAHRRAIDNSEISKHSIGRHHGIVKSYKEEKGFGFLIVHGYPDVFFHIHDLNKIGIRKVQKGDRFYFDIHERVDKDNRTTFRARKMEIHESTSSAHSKQQTHEKNTYNNGNSGAMVTIPNPVDVRPNTQPHYVVSGHRGEIVVKNLNAKTSSVKPTSKPINMSSKIKVGLPCVVPLPRNNPSIVSATGPNSAEMSQPVKKHEDPEVLKLKETIGKKKSLFKSLKLEKLPDGGRRLKDEIISLELKLKDMSLKKKSNEENRNTRSTEERNKENEMPKPKLDLKPKPIAPPSLDSYTNKITSNAMQPGKKFSQTKLTFPKAEPVGSRIGQVDLDAYDMGPMQFNNGQLYGGRMTSTRLTEVRKVTKAAIEDMHKSLETRPEPDGELEDPHGVKVTLMLHQRQALAWLVWRESQSMSGGILADDMGLGKTLTMISLILKQRENAELNGGSEAKEEYDIKDFDSSSDSNDSDIILVEDDKSKIKGEKSEDVEENTKPELVQTESTLIVAPASLLFHWEKEIRNRCNKGLLSIHLFHGTSREKEPTRLAEFDVVITTYDIVRRSASGQAKNDKQESTLMQINWNRIILDEAHQIKNFKSASSEAACKLEAKTRWAMSGTPVQNNLTDMYAMLKFLHCRPFDEYKVWKHQVDNKTTNGKERLKTLVSCIVLRREKSQNGTTGKPLVNLPKRSFVTHKLKLNDVEREVYDKLQSDSQDAFRKFQDKKQQNADRKHTTKSHISGPGNLNTGAKSKQDDSMTATTLLVMLLRLRQCCGHLSLLKKSFDPELLSNEKKELALEDMFQSMDINKTPVKMADINVGNYVEKDKAKYFEMSSASGKVEFVMDELNRMRIERPDDKCVIVSQWTSMLEVVAHHLEKSNVSYVIIKGSVSAKKRMDMVDDFNRHPTRPKVILLSLQAGGVGLNLIGGNHLFLLDMHWNPALESQAFDRIYRVGQTKPVFIHKFVVENTVEERISKLQEYKLSIAKAVMQGAGLEDRKKLSLQDMKLLFGI